MSDVLNNKPQNAGGTEEVLLSLLRHTLFGEEYNRKLPPDEVLAALDEAKKQSVSCLAFESARELADIGEKAVNFYGYYKKNMLVHWYHSILHDIMTKADIPYTVLKGAASAHYYPQPQLRMMGDVDFLVSPEDLERGKKALEAEGFVRMDMNHDCHEVYKKEEMHFEMHFEPAGIPYGEKGEYIRGIMKGAVESARCVKTENGEYMCPSPFYHGLIMLLHMQHHMLAEGIGLRHLCDWAVFIDKFSDEEYREIFSEKLRNAGLLKFSEIISLTAHIALNIRYRDFMGRDFDTAGELLSDIFASGNFGKKDSVRSSEGLFISNRGKDGIKRTRITQFAVGINRIVYTKFPVMKKHKILLPAGWIYVGGRRIIRQIKGERKPLQLRTAYASSLTRKELYKKLGLFESES